MFGLKSSLVALLCLAALASACDEEEKPAAKPAPSAAAAPPPATTTAKPKETKPERPQNLEYGLTDARREKIEKAHPEAKGFVVMKELEEKLKSQKNLKETKDGIRAFDALAKGKWVLFTGPLVEANDTGFSIGVSYTPLVKGDRVGLSRQFFLVALTDVKGYEAKDMKNGTPVAVVAKYEGSGKGSPGFELWAENNW